MSQFKATLQTSVLGGGIHYQQLCDRPCASTVGKELWSFVAENSVMTLPLLSACHAWQNWPGKD
jgi:hypothetical protein